MTLAQHGHGGTSAHVWCGIEGMTMTSFARLPLLYTSLTTITLLGWIQIRQRMGKLTSYLLGYSDSASGVKWNCLAR